MRTGLLYMTSGRTSFQGGWDLFDLCDLVSPPITDIAALIKGASFPTKTSVTFVIENGSGSLFESLLAIVSPSRTCAPARARAGSRGNTAQCFRSKNHCLLC